ncbi:MAG: aspartate-semialdehyde dehydrogenase [Gammaproteobacteria bacterium]|nr:MAG: aspartate-semialdehyde dehydrogenase [Gammaproteobacteria bacterium]
MFTVNIVVVGATGAVGEALIEALDEADFTSGDLYLAASESSVGETKMYKKRPVLVEDLASFDFSRVQLAFFAVPEQVSRDCAELVVSAGCQLIDFSACFRDDPAVPLMVAGVNSHVLEGGADNLVALPDSLTVDLSHVLYPIHQDVEVVRLNVATYQAVSSAGQKGIKELAGQTASLLNGLPVEAEAFAQQIAFNVIPEVGGLLDSGHSRAEVGLVGELRCVLEDAALAVSATCVQVPVFYGSCQVVNIETRYPYAVDEVISVLNADEDVNIFSASSNQQCPAPITVADMAARGCCVGRIRASIGVENGIDLWIVSDNVRKSAVKNAIAVAKLLLKDSL